MGRYHGTGMVVGKAGRSLITGLKHRFRCHQFLEPGASLGQPFDLIQSSGRQCLSPRFGLPLCKPLSHAKRLASAGRYMDTTNRPFRLHVEFAVHSCKKGGSLDRCST
jgi:hypothetical protein